jgi:glycosyltransferase involved in cell wall biosynthesis
LVLLKWFDARARMLPAGHRWRLPYCVDAITEAGFRLETSDAALRPPWTRQPARGLIHLVEKLGAPILQTLLATRVIGRSDATLAMFESQGNALAALRRFGLAPFTRPAYAIVACWLARDAEKFGRVRRFVYSQAYRSVDRVFFFSSNQAALLHEQLGIPAERLCFVPFGVDHRIFLPSEGVRDGGYVLAVGRDMGRDWPTLFEAFRSLELPLKVATREHVLNGLDIPSNVDVLGFVDRSRYRDLLAAARLVVVTTQDLPYPTGQTVTLEAMAMGKCCVVTDTLPMRDYLRDGENAVLVPPRDVDALRAAIVRAWSDHDLRDALGRAARRSVQESFNAEKMWYRIGEMLEEACAERARSARGPRRADSKR